MTDPQSRRFAAVRMTIALVVAVAATGCAVNPVGTAAVSPTPSATAVSAATRTPEQSAASATASTASQPSDPNESLEPPPSASLVAGPASHVGEAGSWAWAGGTSDSPWLPAAALEQADIPAGTVKVELGDGVEVASWSVAAATAGDTQGVDVDALGDGSGTPTFEIARGDWVVAVDVRFANGLGSAIYYWHLVVT